MSDQPSKRTIGFFAALWHETAHRQLEGMLRYLDDEPGLTLRDFRFLGDVETDELAPPPPWTGTADGVILCVGCGSVDKTVAWVRRGGAPAVSLVREWTHPWIPTVCSDTDAVTRLAADWLVEKGYQHFAFVADTVAPADTARRREVFCRQLAPHGYEPLGYDLTFRAYGAVDDMNRVKEEKELVRLLKDAPKPLAVFAQTDNHARAVCWLCGEMGLDVPGEVAILGGGNLTIGRCHSPTISSVATANDRIGFEAIKVLHQIMDGGERPKRPKLLGPEGIVQRESTGMPQNDGGDIRRARDFIHAHAVEGITVEDVVRGLSISRRTLEKQFTERIGHSPKQEIQLVRLEKAKQLLTDTELSMTQVSAMTGFSEPPRFSSFFRKHLGMSPTEYRETRSER